MVCRYYLYKTEDIFVKMLVAADRCLWQRMHIAFNIKMHDDYKKSELNKSQ